MNRQGARRNSTAEWRYNDVVTVVYPIGDGRWGVATYPVAGEDPKPTAGVEFDAPPQKFPNRPRPEIGAKRWGERLAQAFAVGPEDYRRVLGSAAGRIWLR